MFLEHKAPGEITPDMESGTLADWQRLLLKAADLIEEYGLAKMATCDERRRLCVRGALLVADGAPHEYAKPDMGYASRTVREADRRLEIHLKRCPADWNNDSNRTKEEVIAKLRSVALGG